MTAAVLPPLASLIQRFFQEHLVVERNASPNTVLAYRDSIKLFLCYTSQQRGCSPDALDHDAFDDSTVRAFLAHLVAERGSATRTRNQRLAALKALARYIASVAPEQLARCQRVRQLAPLRVEHREVQYLDDDEVALLLGGRRELSRRDRAMLLLLYNTGARVQELVDLNVSDLQLQPLPLIRLLGKGRKQRTCPLWSRTAVVLKEWLAQRVDVTPAAPLFLNARGQRFSRSGIAHVLRVTAHRAKLAPRHAARVTPHVVRHTTAMHLLRSGADITTIAAWLGHAQLNTTHGYVEITLRMKAAAIAAAIPPTGLKRRNYPAPDLVAWLEALRARATPDYVERQPRSSTRRARSST